MKTAHRKESRAKRDRHELPKFWRPKLAASTVIDARAALATNQDTPA